MITHFNKIGGTYENDSALPEWAQIISNYCNAAYTAKLDAVNPEWAEDVGGVERGKIWDSEETQSVHKALIEMKRWIQTESLVNPKHFTFLYILIHWLQQDPDCHEATHEDIQTAIYNLSVLKGDGTTGKIVSLINGKIDEWKEEKGKKIKKFVN